MRHISKDEQILFVPHKCLITADDVQKTPITRKLVE
jgi:hypothetical protein